MADEKHTSVNVLILCDRECEHGLFESLFNISGLAAELTQTEEKFYERLEHNAPEVILLAMSPPDERALGHVAKLRQPGSTWREIPIVVIFPENTPKEIALASLYQGAYDYLTEPFNEIELLTKITVLAKIKHAEDEFRSLAIRDMLTGLYDRRYLHLRLHEEMSRARRYSKPISVLAIDIDGIGKVNDAYGAEAGDLLLQSVADELRRCKREIDVLARKENDEFDLVLYNTDMTGASVLATRILDQMQKLQFRFDPQFKTNASLGLCSCEAGPEMPQHGQELLLRAEQALARAQEDGGGRVVIYGSGLE
jgi:two-component system, cell cycle response regulator